MKKIFSKLGDKLAYIIIGVILAIASTAYAVNVSVPQATQKGDVPTGLTTGNYQLLHPGTNGYVLSASSTSANGLAWIPNTAASGATTTISVSGVTNNGPSFVYATGSPATGLNLLITSNGSGTITWTPQLQSGYSIPLTASTTNWNSFYDTPSSRVNAGNNLFWSGNTLNATVATTTINNLNGPTFTIASGTSGTIFNIQNSGSTVTLNLPIASSTATGQLSATDWSTFNNKLSGNQTITLSGVVSGSGATSIFTSFNSTTPVTFGGTGTTTAPADNALLVGLGSAYAQAVLPSCSNAVTSKLLYNNTTHAFSCGTDQTGGGGGATTTINSATGPAFTFATGSATGLDLLITDNGASTVTFTPQLQAGYGIPLTASSTNWNNFYNTPSTRITAGTNLAWSGNTLNATVVTSTINSATGPAFNFATGSDTNILFTITSSGSTATFTPSWTGTLADGRIASAANWNAVYNNVLSRLAVSSTTGGSLFYISTSTNSIVFNWPSNLLSTTTAAATYLTAVTGSGNILSSGGLTPNITTVISPSFTGLTVTATSSLGNASSSNLSVSSLTPGNCVQAGAGGLLTTVGFACGSGGTGNAAWTIGNGVIYNATSTDKVGVGTSTPAYKLDVQGSGTLDPFNITSSTGANLLTVTANNRVGVSTAVPNSTFSVGGDSYFSGKIGIGRLPLSGTSFAILGSGTDDLVTVASSSANYFTVKSDGRVGIGNTVSPAGTLGLIGLVGTNLFTLSSSTGTRLLTVDQSGSLGLSSSTPGSQLTILGTAIQANRDYFNVSSSSGANLFIINSSGNVGIGTSTPQAPLVVSGSTTITSLNAPNCDVLATASGALVCGTNGGGAGATSTISVSGVVNNGPNFTFATGTAMTGLDLLITSNGSGSITWTNALQAGYNIPLTASTTNWNNFYNTPSTRITAGNNLSWSGNTLNATAPTTTVQTGAGGTTLNGPAFVLATGSDTNLQLNITGSGSTATFTPVWTGTLAAARLNSNVVQSVSTTSAGSAFTASISAQNLALTFPANLLTTTSAASTYVTQVTGSGNILSSGGLTPNITTVISPSFTGLTVTSTSTISNASITAVTLSGPFYDAGQNVGTLGMVLQSTGTSTRWVATSTLGITSTGGSGNAAWTIGSGAIYNATTTDRVGVGTTSPMQGFSVASTTYFADRVGIGTASPSRIFTVFGSQSGGIAEIRRDAGLGILGNTVYGTQVITAYSATTTGGFPDLTGPAQTFKIATNTMEQTVGDIGATRDGADNVGSFFIRPYVAGTPQGGLTLAGNSSKYSATIQGTAGAGGIFSVTTSTGVSLFQVNANPSLSTVFVTAATSTNYAFGVGSAPGERLFDVLANGRVGISTTGPIATLSVRGTSTAPTVPLLAVASSSNALLLSVLPSTTAPSLVVNGSSTQTQVLVVGTSTPFFTIQVNGNVGIGTTTPNRPLLVIGSTTISSLNAANCDVMADANGGLACGVNSGSYNATAGRNVYFTATSSSSATFNTLPFSTFTVDYTVPTSTTNFTSIQAALDACATSTGGTIWLLNDIYAQGSVGLRWKSSDCTIWGRSASTTISFTGATTLFKTNSAAAQYSRVGLHHVVITGDGNASGVAIDMSDMSHAEYEDIQIDNVATGFVGNDTQNITFYNTAKNISITTVSKFGFNASSTNAFNDNIFENFFVGCAAADCVAFQMNHGNNNKFYGFKSEPATTTRVTGIRLFDTPGGTGTFDNQFYGSYIEGNTNGISIAATAGSTGGIKRNMFIGGIIDANTNDITASSTTGYLQTFFGVDKNFGNPLTSIQAPLGINNISATALLDIVEPTFGNKALSIKNNTDFAQNAADFVQFSLLNASDSANLLNLSNAGTGYTIIATSTANRFYLTGSAQLSINSTTPGSLVTIQGTTTALSNMLLTVASSSQTSFLNVDSAGTVGVFHLKGLTSTPTVATSTGVGTGSGSSVDLTGTDMSGFLSWKTSNSGLTRNATATLITFSKAYSSPPFCTWGSATSAPNTIFRIYASTTPTTLRFVVDGAPLATSAVYSLYYHCDQ